MAQQIHLQKGVPLSQTAVKTQKEKLAFYIKWVASIVQIAGYTTRAFGMTPWNVYLFVVGLIGWFIVGVLWNDRAIMLIHIVALSVMVVGIASTAT